MRVVSTRLLRSDDGLSFFHLAPDLAYEERISEHDPPTQRFVLDITHFTCTYHQFGKGWYLEKKRCGVGLDFVCLFSSRS